MRSVHPAAAIFPMMSDEELADLADDIKANGQIHPIVLDADGQLIDGRNRLRACELAEVEPRFETLNGHDPVAYILGSNVTRRHLSKGQAAMACVKAFLVSKKPSLLTIERSTGINQTRIVQAQVVLDYAPELADAVLSGAIGLDAAYAEARERKEAAEALAKERQEAAESVETQMATLRASAPDLADQVVEETLTLAEANAAAKARIDEALAKAEAERVEFERRRRVNTSNLRDVLLLLNPGGQTGEERASTWAPYIDPNQFIGIEYSEALMTACIATLTALRDQLAE